MIHCLLIKITNEKDHPNHNGGSKLTFPYTKEKGQYVTLHLQLLATIWLCN